MHVRHTIKDKVAVVRQATLRGMNLLRDKELSVVSMVIAANGPKWSFIGQWCGWIVDPELGTEGKGRTVTRCLGVDPDVIIAIIAGACLYGFLTVLILLSTLN